MADFFDPANISLSRDDDGTLQLHRDGQIVRLGAPRRALPLSQPERFIALMDEDGSEIGVVRAPEELEENSRKLLEDELKVAYRVERIVRVLKVEKEPLSGQTKWKVEIARDTTESDSGEDEAQSQLETESASTNQNGAAQNGDRKGGASTRAGAERESKFSLFSSDDKSGDTPKLLQSDVLEMLRRKRRQSSTGDETLFGDMDVTESEEREFSINGQEDIQTARYPHIFIVDVDRNRYEILDCEALDLESRREAERFF